MMKQKRKPSYFDGGATEIRGKLSLMGGAEADIYAGLNQTRRVLIYANCVTCAKRLEEKGIKILHDLRMLNAFVAEVPMRAVPVLASKGYIKYIEEDAVVHITMDIARHTVGADLPDCSGLTGKGVTIASVDTGIFPHEDFTLPANRIVKFVDFVNEREAPYDDNGHGTFCMGCAAGSGIASGGEYRGIAPEAGIIMLKAMDAEGGGKISDILRALQWVSDNASVFNIRVLSLSLGIEPLLINPFRDTLAMAAEHLWRKGIVVVAAAGNSGPKEGTINSPGTCKSIITVGAADDRSKEYSVAKFSSRDREGGAKPDVLAPGVNIHCVAKDADKYTIMSGTSVSTPIVAGCAALLLERSPEMSPDDIKNAVKNHAVSLLMPENEQGKGIVSLSGLCGGR